MKISKRTKEHLISAALTFATGIAVVVLPELDNLTVENVQTGALIGLLLSGVRLGLKMVLEQFIQWYSTK